jgi:hypothetical protein
MKESPDMEKLEAVMRSSKLVAGGFLGSDGRLLEEIIEADASALARTGRTREELAARMASLTSEGRRGLGTPVRTADGLELVVEESRGLLVCPWPHPGRYTKTVTTARRLGTGQTVRWSNLSIHMIEAHGFFEGKGAAFRLEPGELAAVVFGPGGWEGQGGGG